MARKPRDYAAEYARRVAGTPKGSRERQIARGHARSESHGFRPKEITRRGKSGQEVGRPVKEGPAGQSGFGGGKTPANQEVLSALRRIRTEDVLIYIQIISREKSPSKKPTGKGDIEEEAEGAVEWYAIRQDRQLVQDILQRTGSQVEAANLIFGFTRPVENVLSWQFFPVES